MHLVIALVFQLAFPKFGHIQLFNEFKLLFLSMYFAEFFEFIF